MKSTLVIGASVKPERYSYKAIHQLREKGHPVYAFALRQGNVADVEFETEWNENWQVDSVTLYINSHLQKSFYDKIISLKPKRVIFNPGTENPELQRLLIKNNIAFENACTLVLLSIDQY